MVTKHPTVPSLPAEKTAGAQGAKEEDGGPSSVSGPSWNPPRSPEPPWWPPCLPAWLFQP